MTGLENTVRPRGYYRSCRSCELLVLTLADVDDALALCRAVLSDWLRKGRHHADKIDAENVLGDLYAHVWYLYNRWVPNFGDGRGTFTGYASRILSQKVNTFVARDVGDPTGKGRGPKAHSRSSATSYEGLTESSHNVASATGRGGLDGALGFVAVDDTGGYVPGGRTWHDIWADRPGAGAVSAGSVEA
jgi:hypothetical protein